MTCNKPLEVALPLCTGLVTLCKIRKVIDDRDGEDIKSLEGRNIFSACAGERYMGTCPST